MKYEIEVKRESMSVYLGEAAPENIWQIYDEVEANSEEEALDLYYQYLYENEEINPDDIEILESEIRLIERQYGIPTNIAYYRANCRNLPE